MQVFGIFFYGFMVTINSCLNPVVYMVRKLRLNEYTKSLFSTAKDLFSRRLKMRSA